MNVPPVNVHATAIVLGGLGILIRGASRSGKSSLALSSLRRAESLGLCARLVADDQVFLDARNGCLEALAAPATLGLIEISGVGILREAFVPRAAIGLVVDLLEPDAIERLPEARHAALRGLAIPLVALPRRQASFGADILATLARRDLPIDLNQF